MPPFITLDGLAYRAPDGRSLFENLTLAFGGERTGLLGANGAGKTMLLRMILGELTTMSGAVSARGRIGVLRQNPGLPPGASLADTLGVAADLARLDLDGDIETVLARVGLDDIHLGRPADTLSGGERLRGALACVLMSARPSQLIILDEPTNHLDLDSMEASEQALAAYDGALIIVSHDEDFLAAMAVNSRLDRRKGAGVAPRDRLD